MPCLPFVSEPEAGLSAHPPQSKCKKWSHPFFVLNTSYFTVALTRWQAATTPQSHWKTSHGFRLRSPKVPSKTPPHDVRNASDEAKNWLQLLSVLLFSVSVLKTNTNFPFNGNKTHISIASSHVISNPEDQRDKNQAMESVLTISDPGSTSFPLHTNPSTTTSYTTHKLTQAGYTPSSHSDKEQLCERQTMASDRDTTQ